ncbi:MAG TPA: EVE domain-containing protein [Candidatus Limnocylindrales bacterium]|nr:EVE domain-containing protein [Candidatus Limnocylindrales bacterium]
MAGWLVKQEPAAYSWDRLVEEGRAVWDGVRNAQARNNLAAMKKGDSVLFYHSGDDRAVIGVAKVARTAYPDPTSDDPRWVAVDLVPARKLAHPVTLARIKAHPPLANMALVRQSRLSVMPVTDAEMKAILELAKTSQ